MENNNSQPSVRFDQPSPSAPQKNPKNKFVIIALTLITLGAVGGVYYWQNDKVTGLKSEKAFLEGEIVDLRTIIETLEIARVADANGQSDNAEDTNTGADEASAAVTLKTGQVRYAESGGGEKLVFECYGKPGELGSVWARYGKSPDSLKESAKRTDELGLGDAGKLVSYEPNIQADQLDPGVPYYYQCGATYGDSKTIYSDFVLFTSRK
jgi:hypothetical protein